MSQKYRRIVNELSRASNHPLLFSEDFESDAGTAMSDYTQLVSEMGGTNSILYATWYGEIMSNELRSIGIDRILNPVADLVKNPFILITNTRSIGDNTNRAIKMLPAQVKAMQKNKLAATVKHFPGDGTDYINQYLTTSQMKLSVEEWKQHHGKVFQTLIDSGVMVIMPGHISFPAYQKEQA